MYIIEIKNDHEDSSYADSFSFSHTCKHKYDKYKCTCFAFLLFAVTVPFTAIAVYNLLKQDVALPLAHSNHTAVYNQHF
jgi:hypothetical protein